MAPLGERHARRSWIEQGISASNAAKPDRQLVWVCKGAGFGQYWSQAVTNRRWHYTAKGGAFRDVFAFGPMRRIRVILTVAHLNQTPGDDRPENLKALCQWCHLHLDRQFHLKNARETRMTKKDKARPLLPEASA
jgi:hypothetical protein